MEFIKWFLWILDSKYKTEREGGAWAVLLVDRHSSRLNPDMLEYALRHRLHLVAYPTNTTSILQTLDVSVHGPFKKAVRKLIKVQDDQGKKLTTLSVVRDVVIPAWNESFTADNIRSGFISTGIHPRNRDAISKDKMAAAKLWDKSDRKVEHQGAVFDFSKDAKTASESKTASDFDQYTLNPMPKDLESIIDVPVFGLGKKGKTGQRARLLTHANYIKKVKKRKGGTTAESKESQEASDAAPAKKPAAAPKAKATRKRKRKSKRRSKHSSSESDTDSESDISSATDSDESSDDEAGHSTSTGSSSSSLSLQPGVLGVPKSKQKPSKDYDYATGEELKGEKKLPDSSTDMKDGDQLPGECPKCKNKVYRSRPHRVCKFCECPWHLTCLGGNKRRAIPEEWYCHDCRAVIPT
jgi:hypothetical protein